MKKSRIRKNNRGDSLIIVIGCIALLSILGAVILAKTADNRMMKLEQQKAQDAFAGADKASAQVAAVLEIVAQDAVEAAFKDMMVEYANSADSTARGERFNTFFVEKVKSELPGNDGTLQTLLENALDPTGGVSIPNLTVSYGDVLPEVSTVDGLTSIVRVHDVKLSYSENGSETSITTDICIQARIPNVETGFRTGVQADFSDFALISDGGATVSASEDMNVKGNLYVGDKLWVDGSVAALRLTNMNKVLVGGNIELTNGAKITADSSSVLADGLGIWAEGIVVNKSTLDTNNVSVYVSDDLTVEGDGSVILLEGAGSEYVGYSGKSGDISLKAHRRSSAITINNAKNLQLNLSNLGELYINGNSYIRDTKWDTEAGVEVEGVLQGESVAYKDMQAMYLVPSDYMAVGHNPVLSGESTSVIAGEYKFGPSSDPDKYNLDDYLNPNPSQKFINRMSPLDGGATVATYVYLNFKDEQAAAQYVADYMDSTNSTTVKEHAKNLGSTSRILLPTITITKSNALTYDGTAATLLPAADSAGQTALSMSSISAKRRWESLFSTLMTTGGTAPSADFKMVEEGILVSDAFDGLANGASISVPPIVDPMDNTQSYQFVLYKGDLEINSDTSPYHLFKGILVVDGNVTFAATSTQIEGLVMATGEVKTTSGVTLKANSHIVETLLSSESVAKYFRGYTAGSGQGFISTEAVDITFNNWTRN